MQRWLGCAVLVLGAACASPPEDSEAQVAVTQQAVGLPFPADVGVADAGVGYSLAVCPTNFVYAGAPGAAALWTFGGGLTQSYNGTPNGMGRLTACDQSLSPLSAGTGGIARFNSGSSTWMPMKNGAEFTVLAPEPVTGSPILIGEATGVLHISSSSGSDFKTTDAGPRINAGVWLTSDLFVVSDVVGRRLSFYSWNRMLSEVTLLSVVTVTGPAGFGRALAVGDVSPVNAGPELIVGANDRVLIFSLDGGQLINTLAGGPGFGAALAVEPGAVAGLFVGSVDAVWVGDPSSDVTWRYIGDAGTSYTPAGATPQLFGWSIAVDRQVPPRVFIGAPDFSGNSAHEGAVYQVPTRAPIVGTVGACAGTVSCGACQYCYGGVACLASPSCDAGVPDAGVSNDGGTGTSYDGGATDGGALMDAGASTDGGTGAQTDAGASTDGGTGSSVDAGASSDAGVVDAGAATDAGSTDAGVASDAGLATTDAGSFDSGVTLADAGSMPDGGNDPGDLTFAPRCGCSAFGALPSLLLGLLFTRRWRRQTIPARP